VYLKKNNSNSIGDGDYNFTYNDNDLFSGYTTSLTLSGTGYTTLNVATIGIFIYTVYNTINGAVATFFIAKNVASRVTASISRVSSSLSISGANLAVRWNSNSALELSKTNSSQDGQYYYYNLFSLDDICDTTNVTLSSTTLSAIPIVKYSGSFIIGITSSVIDAPYAIFSVSKGIVSDSTASIVMVVSSNGVINDTTLNVQWGSNSTLSISKSSGSYDGIYIVKIL
jgi:hypothetical protein